MTSNINCICCNTHAVENEATFTCPSCGLEFVNVSTFSLDYEKSYNDGISIYSDHLTALDRFQRVTNIKKYLLPTETAALEYIGGLPRPLSLVDFGCGIGRFLRAAEEQLGSPNVVGYEVVDILVERLLNSGRYVFKGDLNSFLLSEHRAEVIVLLEVLEHLKNPGDTVRKIFEQKKPTALIVAVPCSDSRRIYDSNFAVHDVPPNHLSWWKPSSLNVLLSHEGYRVTVRPIPELRRSLIGHYLRGGNIFGLRNVINLIKSLLFPPAFWYLGIAERI